MSPIRQILEGDVRDILPTLADESIDFVVTSPPYWSILKKEDHKAKQERLANGISTTNYGDDPRDLGNIETYEEFLRCANGDIPRSAGEFDEDGELHGGNRKRLSRHKSRLRHVPLPILAALVLRRSGLEMRGLIRFSISATKKSIPYGYPYSYVPNIHNQFILVLQKPR